MFLGEKTKNKIKNNTSVYSAKVKAVDAAGVATVIVRIERVAISMTGPQGMMVQYDSTEEKDRTGMEKMLDDQSAGILGKPFEMKIDSRGNISDLKLPEAIANDPFVWAKFNPDIINEMFGNVVFPKEAASVGKTWSTSTAMPGLPGVDKAKLEQTFEYTGPDKDDVNLENIKVTGKMESKLVAENELARMNIKSMQYNGKVLFDNKAGRLNRSTITTKIDLEVVTPIKTISGSINMTMEIKLVPNNGAK